MFQAAQNDSFVATALVQTVRRFTVSEPRPSCKPTLKIPDEGLLVLLGVGVIAGLKSPVLGRSPWFRAARDRPSQLGVAGCHPWG
jgi:hypothetical protein